MSFGGLSNPFNDYALAMYLLDTNHCSRLIDNNPSISQRLVELGDAFVSTCVIVEGELAFMVGRSTRKTENEKKVGEFLKDIEVFPVDRQVANLYGNIKTKLIEHYAPHNPATRKKVELSKLGFYDNDLWIAAIALHKGFTVVSDDRGFLRMSPAIGLSVENWVVS